MLERLKKRGGRASSREWEKSIRRSFQTLIDSLYLSGLLLINLILATVAIVVLGNWVSIELIDVSIHHTVGIYLMLVLVGIVVLSIFALERSGWIRNGVEAIGKRIWTTISHEESDNLEGDEKQEFEVVQGAYVEEFSKAIPLMFLGLTAPFLLVYTYTDPFDFAALSILYIIFGIIFGAVRTAFMRRTVFHQDSERYRQEMGESISKQMEVILLITAAMAQLMSSFNLGLSDVSQILATFGLSLLAAAPAFLLFFYYGPPVSVVNDDS